MFDICSVRNHTGSSLTWFRYAFHEWLEHTHLRKQQQFRTELNDQLSFKSNPLYDTAANLLYQKVTDEQPITDEPDLIGAHLTTDEKFNLKVGDDPERII